MDAFLLYGDLISALSWSNLESQISRNFHISSSTEGKYSRMACQFLKYHQCIPGHPGTSFQNVWSNTLEMARRCADHYITVAVQQLLWTCRSASRALQDGEPTAPRDAGLRCVGLCYWNHRQRQCTRTRLLRQHWTPDLLLYPWLSRLMSCWG